MAKISFSVAVFSTNQPRLLAGFFGHLLLKAALLSVRLSLAIDFQLYYFQRAVQMTSTLLEQ